MSGMACSSGLELLERTLAISEPGKPSPLTAAPYLDAASDARGEPPVWHIVGRRSAESGDPERVSVGLRGRPASLAAAQHALLSGKTLLLADSVEELPNLLRTIGRVRSVAISLDRADVREVGMDALADAMRDAGVRRWGLLSASTLPALTRLVARIATRREPAPTEGLLFSPDDDGWSGVRGMAHQTLPALPSAAFREAIAERPTLVIAVGHGRPYCALEGNFCSLPTAAVAGDARCHPGYDCIYADASRVPAHTLPCDVVVLETCASAALTTHSPLTAPETSVALRLLEGTTTAVVGVTRNHVVTHEAPHLIWSFASGGASLGEIVGHLNDWAENTRGLPRPYLLLGDPDMRVFAAPGPARAQPEDIDVERSVAASDAADREGTPPVEQARSATHARAFELLGRHLDRVSRTARWLPQSSQEAILAFQRSLAAGEAAVAALEPHVGRSPDHRSALEGLVRDLLLESIGVDGVILEALRERARSDVQFIAALLCDAVGIRQLGAERAPAPCEVCGRGVVWERSYQVGVLAARRRIVRECSSCLVVADVPMEGPVVWLEGPRSMRPEETNRLVLRGEFSDQEDHLVTCGLAMHLRGRDPSAFRCVPDRLTVRARGSLAVSFDVVADSCLPRHGLWINAVAVIEGEVAVAIRCIDLVGA